MSEPDDQWRAAFGALMETEDVKPLAAMLGGDAPIPPWIRQGLAELLRPTRPLLIGNDPESKAARLDLKNADRLVFERTDATRRKIKTHAKRVAVGLAVMEAKAAGKKHKTAVTEVVKRLGSNGSDTSYVEHSVKHAKTLPISLRGAARKLDDF